AVMGADERLEAYARLIVRVGLNLQAGQDVGIDALVEHAPLVEAVARAAYEAGARYVDASYSDYRVKRALIELGPAQSLDWTPPHRLTRLADLAEGHGARGSITGDPEAELLGERRFDAIRFRGPGTDLTVGLLPGAAWDCAESVTTWGQRHVPNLPTEEVFTTPDRRRTEGVVRSTRPLGLKGTLVKELE